MKNRETKLAATVINTKTADVIQNAATIAVLFCNNCQIFLLLQVICFSSYKGNAILSCYCHLSLSGKNPFVLSVYLRLTVSTH